MSALSERIVNGEGKIPCRLMLVGEAPGREEAARGRPFVGKTGKEQDAHLERNGFSRRDFYITNLRKTFIPGNPAPTPEEAAKWGPVLEEEIRVVNPKFIVAVGTHAVRYFLGDNTSLDAVHGIPHRWKDRVILPGYHPAAHFCAPDLLQFIIYDYARAAAAIRGDIPLEPPADEFPEGYTAYVDGDDRDLEERYVDCAELAYDTEGVPGDEWSFQVTGRAGEAVVCRNSNPRFKRSLSAFRRIIKGKTLIGHNQLYELEMFRSMGLDLLDPALKVRFWDTMMAAYLTAMEPQSLKNLARRHCGMVMKDYMDTVGDAGKAKQMAYLEMVWQDASFPKPEPRVERENDGTCRVYTPQPIQRRAEAILVDVYSGKKDKEGNLIDPFKRWKKVDRIERLAVEKKYGPMPVGTLADIPLADAVYYAGRDPDATLRVYHYLKPALAGAKLESLMAMKMAMYPAAAEIKLNGFLASRKHFEWLVEEMWDQMDRISAKISKNYYSGRPFNPNSPDDVATLMRRQGLEGAKRTKKTGKVSTSKKSIEHLRFDNEPIELVQSWRERGKVRDSFGTKLLELFPEDVEQIRISGDLKMTRVSSGRFSMTNPPLMAIPVRSDLGQLVREGFIAEDGYVLGTWDLDQVEMRVMADESGDERLLRLFNEDKVDIHTDTASRIFKIPYERVGKMEHRYPAKRAGFGIITGIQGPGLFDQLRMAGCQGWSVEKCDQLIRDWLNLFPGVKHYMEACGVECERNGGVIKDRWGMPRYLPQILSDDRYERFEARRQSHSHKIQGGAQGLLQNAMGWIYPRLKVYGDAVRWILQIHDELIMEVAKGLEEEVDAIMIEGLTQHGAQLRVPVKSKGSYGPNWKLLEK